LALLVVKNLKRNYMLFYCLDHPKSKQASKWMGIEVVQHYLDFSASHSTFHVHSFLLRIDSCDKVGLMARVVG
jgi:hypothetical protein